MTELTCSAPDRFRMVDVAFILTKSDRPFTAASVAEHASTFKLPLVVSNETTPDQATELSSFSLNDGRPGLLVSTFLPVPHPDTASIGSGPDAPTRDHVALVRSHIVLVGFGIEGNSEAREALMHQFAATVALSTDAVAAMLGSGTDFVRHEIFIESAHEITKRNDLS